MSDNQSFSQFISSLAPSADGLMAAQLIARVAHVVQGPYLVGTNVPDIFYTNPTDIGSITFQLINSNQSATLASNSNVIARPISSAFKHIPVEGELVYLIPGPSVDMNTSSQRQDYYYLQPYNLWNAANHNAFPNMADFEAFISTVDNRSYEDSMNTKQSINTSVTGSTTMPLGPNFPEKANIRTLRQFTGDVTVEGRWGNSIRFGSTVAIDGYQNSWSSEGAPGTPITILRNGQGTPSDILPWFPTVENINRDASSIYLTAGQKIVIDDINNNFSLISLQAELKRTQTGAIPIQQQLTSTSNLSALEQDRRIDSINS